MQRTYQPTQASRNGLINRHAESLSMLLHFGARQAFEEFLLAGQLGSETVEYQAGDAGDSREILVEGKNANAMF